MVLRKPSALCDDLFEQERQDLHGFFFFLLPDTHLGVKRLGNVRSHQVRHPGEVTDWEITHIFRVLWEPAF